MKVGDKVIEKKTLQARTGTTGRTDVGTVTATDADLTTDIVDYDGGPTVTRATPIEVTWGVLDYYAEDELEVVK